MTLTLIVDKGSGDDYGDNGNHCNTEQDQNDQRSMSMLIVDGQVSTMINNHDYNDNNNDYNDQQL